MNNPVTVARQLPKQLFRGLRFRLTITYILFITVLLVSLGALFQQRLDSVLHAQIVSVLDEEWGALKGYRNSETGKSDWFYDKEDPDEAAAVNQIRRVFLMTDANGKIVECSEDYRSLGLESAAQIKEFLKTPRAVKWREQKDEQDTPYLIRSAALNEGGKLFYVSIGRSLERNVQIAQDFRFFYKVSLPLLLLASCVLGWWMAGPALRPVEELARSAQRITSENLNAQIPLRGAGDELDHLIDTFNQMITRLGASFAQTRQFSTDVSHELRTPLTAIRGQLEVALLTAETPEQYRNAIMDALQDVERLSQTIRALLLLSQAESGQLTLQKYPLELAHLLRDLVEQYQIPAESAGVELTVETPRECQILADRVQIERLIYNLLSNAVKYTAPGGKVRVTLTSPPEGVQLAVADTGQGIPPDHLPHIFDRFYRVPTTDRNPERGLGLGLSFVAWIVKAHDGLIHVSSTPGQGSQFVVSFPHVYTGPAADDALQLLPSGPVLR